MKVEIDLCPKCGAVLDDGICPKCGRHRGDTVTVRDSFGHPMKGEILDIRHEDKLYYIVSYIGLNGKPGVMRAGDAELDGFMTEEDIQRRKAVIDWAVAEVAREKAGDELVFSNHGRCYAAIVGRLPEKTSKFSNGYVKQGSFRKGRRTYTVYRDRDDDGPHAYFAVRD